MNRMALCAALPLALAGCRAPPPRVGAPDRSAPPAAHELELESNDWHGLVIAPFGSALKDVPIALHEVLLFRDDGAADNAAAAAECYAADAPAPRFLGRTPDEYVLCFKQDRLSRIQAAVLLAAAEADGVFASACAAWLRSAGTAAPDAAAPGAAAACEGRDGAVRFRGRLEQEAESTLSITLDAAADP
ncbi:MAG: hypothetical protein ACYDAH_04740 [Steroidobacteraceae bacterium]